MSNHTPVDLSTEAIAFADWMAALNIPEAELDAIRTRVESVHMMASEPQDVTYREPEADRAISEITAWVRDTLHLTAN